MRLNLHHFIHFDESFWDSYHEGELIMATLQDIQDDLNVIVQQTGDYVAERDLIDADLKAQLADALAQVGQVDPAVQAQIDAAFATAEAAKALLAPKP